jgi:serine/threonine-protein kinase
MGRFLKGLAIFVALTCVAIVSAFAVVALLLRQEEVRVPDLTGQEIVTVIETVRRLGLQLTVDRREPHATLPRDAVISQSPAAGSGIKKGRLVHVVISQGPSGAQAIKLIGENFRKADIMIRQAGFLPGQVSRVSSDSIDRDIVIAQAPEPGGPLEKGNSISVLVSAGKKTPRYSMPALTGKKAEEAIRTINRMGLRHRVVASATGVPMAGVGRVVIHQKPEAGYPVALDTIVEIAVNR